MTQFEAAKALFGNSLSYYLIAVGMDSTYSYVNRRYATMFSPLYGELVGKHYAITVHPDDQEVCQVVSEMAFKNPNRLFPATLRKYDGKGGFIITRWEYKAIFDKEGNPEGIFCIGHDITELAQLSGELQQVKYDHSHLVRKHLANLIGLSKLMDHTEDLTSLRKTIEMIADTADALDLAMKALYK